MPRGKGIVEEFHAYFRESCESVLLTEDVEQKRLYFLRPSQLPFCGLRRFLDFATEGIQYTRDIQAPTLFFTKTGHTTHEVFQRIMGRGGRIIGNWKCPSCHVKRTLTTYRRCKACDLPMRHVEVELKNRAWRGHLDNIYVAENGEWWIIDYKTCRIDFIFKKKWGPQQSYIEQQNHYVALLEEKLGRKIAGWMLVYLAREHPIKYQRIISRKLKEETKEKLKAKNKLYSNLHKQIFVVKKMSQVRPLYDHKRCRSVEEHDRIFRFDDCKYRNDCFKHRMIARIRKIVEKSPHLPLVKFMPKDIRHELYSQTH